MAIIGDIHPEGAFLNLQIGVSVPRATVLSHVGKPIPGRVGACGLIDTGASGTLIDEAIINALGIPASGYTNMSTPSTRDKPVEVPTYDVEISLELMGLGTSGAITRIKHAVPVIATDFSSQTKTDALVGRDLLSELILVYNGYEKRFSISF